MILVMLPLFLYVAIFEARRGTRLAGLRGHRTVCTPAGAADSPVRFLGAMSCPLDFLASSALLVSAGLALATWVRRLGRAVTLSVIVFFLIGMVWPMLVGIVRDLIFGWLSRNRVTPGKLNNYEFIMSSLMALSPIAGPLNPLHVFMWNQTSGAGQWIGQAVIIGVKASAARLLLVLSIRTFDRCLGRIPDSPAGRGRDEAVVLEEISLTL